VHVSGATGVGFGETGLDEIASIALIYLYAVLNLDPRYNDLAPRSGTSESASDILRRLKYRANRPEKTKNNKIKKKKNTKKRMCFLFTVHTDQLARITNRRACASACAYREKVYTPRRSHKCA